ncbi:hypothetical protein B1F79_00750 [Coxiella-like endosymbiont of Rhipicephalus sanguineus]|nr:hypothetical protein [Coxiella-like endosymbiont of Rhipicephalus sanguineus]
MGNNPSDMYRLLNQYGKKLISLFNIYLFLTKIFRNSFKDNQTNTATKSNNSTPFPPLNTSLNPLFLEFINNPGPKFTKYHRNPSRKRNAS